MESFGILFTIITWVLVFYTIYHLWKKSCWFGTIKKIIYTLVLLFFPLIGIVCYWIGYILRSRKNSDEDTEDVYEGCDDEDLESTSEECESEDSAEEERRKQFQALLASSTELCEIYNKLYNTFIPKDNGDYKGAFFTGLLDVKTRAKRLADAHPKVLSITDGDSDKYMLFFGCLYDNVIEDMVHSSNGKLSLTAVRVLEDMSYGDSLVEELGIMDKFTEFLLDPDTEKAEIKIETRHNTVKLLLKYKGDKLYYETKNLYEAIKHGYCLTDRLIKWAEIIMVICNKYEYGLDSKFSKNDVEKYELPNMSWMNLENRLFALS